MGHHYGQTNTNNINNKTKNQLSPQIIEHKEKVLALDRHTNVAGLIHLIGSQPSILFRNWISNDINHNITQYIVQLNLQTKTG